MTHPPQKPTDDMREGIDSILVKMVYEVMLYPPEEDMLEDDRTSINKTKAELLALFATQTAQLERKAKIAALRRLRSIASIDDGYARMPEYLQAELAELERQSDVT